MKIGIIAHYAGCTPGFRHRVAFKSKGGGIEERSPQDDIRYPQLNMYTVLTMNVINFSLISASSVDILATLLVLPPISILGYHLHTPPVQDMIPHKHTPRCGSKVPA